MYSQADLYKFIEERDKINKEIDRVINIIRKSAKYYNCRYFIGSDFRWYPPTKESPAVFHASQYVHEYDDWQEAEFPALFISFTDHQLEEIINSIKN